ncbi:tail tube protein [uncultured Caudovirales phage]|uniref:Tail tube protein n=1 Tax=uncultured Caudovirales phage TaxID=2100421 RepID=A0A6J5KT97_9CAUD|nr:tail tube protein [uncultured Caudovirales phage]
MAFNVNSFRQQMVGDGARPNLFEVRMAVPSFASSGDTDRKISFMCNAAQLPGSTIGQVTSYYFGREAKFAGNRTYPDWTISVINDEDFAVRNSMERWINNLNDPVQNLRSRAAAVVDGGYGTDATVIQYGKTGDVLKTYNFVGMFPVDVSPIEVSWGANDQIEEFQITLAFQYWTSTQNNTTVGNVLRGFRR